MPLQQVISDDYLFDDDTRMYPGSAAAAILITPDNRYLLQLRDSKRGIFFPGHWGCFGGAIEHGDASVKTGLLRELREEIGLNLDADNLTFFTNYTFDMNFCGAGVIFRTFYETPLSHMQLRQLRLGEGSDFRTFTAREALLSLKLTPYDEFAIWMHASRQRLSAKSRD